jgi:membrane protease YdiL (CAAX protease family)
MRDSEGRERDTRGLWIFVVVVLGLPVLYWLLFELAERSGVEIPRFLAGSLRSYGPTVAAIAALAYVRGRAGLVELGSKVLHWRAPARLWTVAVVAPLLALTAILFTVWIFAPESMTRGDQPLLRLIPIFVAMIFLDGPLGEEPGWRGYFLPTLDRRYGPVAATLLLAVVWYLWHLPHYHRDGRDMDPDFLVRYLLFTIAIAFLHTWFYQRAGGGVVLHVVFHNMTNFIVLAGFTLFPAFREETLDNTVYLVLAMAIGSLAAASVWRRGRIETPVSRDRSGPG